VLLPGSALLSPRGKVLENGMPRFFRRLSEGVFDEADLRRRAHELADFVQEAREAYGIAEPVAVGFSNGANIAAAVLLLRPEALAGAAPCCARWCPFRSRRKRTCAERPCSSSQEVQTRSSLGTTPASSRPCLRAPAPLWSTAPCRSGMGSRSRMSRSQSAGWRPAEPSLTAPQQTSN